MGMSDKRKQSLYFPADMLKEIQAEANRQDRSLSWIVQKAFKIAQPELKKFPSVNEVEGVASIAPAPSVSPAPSPLTPPSFRKL